MLIGLSQRVLFHKDRAHDAIEHGWYSFLSSHALYMIPNRVEQDFSALASKLDVLILTGGDDSPIRLITEIKIAVEMLKLGKPIIGVCHGAFVLTELLGGVVAKCDSHMDTEHFVTYGKEQYRVNSFHSNSIEKSPPKAVVLAVDSRGKCEAWVDGNISAIVWHPERMKSPFLPREIREFLDEKKYKKVAFTNGATRGGQPSLE